MKVVIMSDSHENFIHTQWCLDYCKTNDIERAIHLGDFCNPGLANLIIASGMQLHVVFGNNDGELVLLTRNFLEVDATVGPWSYDELTIDQKKVFITHYPVHGEHAAAASKYDAVFYGHNHEKQESVVNNTLLVNPGELSGHITGTVSFYVWDTDTNTGQFVLHPNPTIARNM